MVESLPSTHGPSVFSLQYHKTEQNKEKEAQCTGSRHRPTPIAGADVEEDSGYNQLNFREKQLKTKASFYPFWF